MKMRVKRTLCVLCSVGGIAAFAAAVGRWSGFHLTTFADDGVLRLELREEVPPLDRSADGDRLRVELPVRPERSMTFGGVRLERGVVDAGTLIVAGMPQSEDAGRYWAVAAPRLLVFAMPPAVLLVALVCLARRTARRRRPGFDPVRRCVGTRDAQA